MSTMRIHQRGRPPYPGILTPAEQHVLEYVREGLTNAEIAYRLGISPDGVKYHVSNMLAKLDLPDRYALAKWEPRGGRTGWMARLSGWLPVIAIPKAAGVVLGSAAVLAIGAGVVVAFGMMATSTSQAPVATTGTAAASPKQTLDTGYGWQYVIDSITTDPSAVHVTYHVEGNVVGLVPATQPVPSSDSIAIAPFPGGSHHIGDAEAKRLPGATTVTVEFASAARFIEAPISVRLTRIGSDWEPGHVTIAGEQVPVSVTSISDEGRQFISLKAQSTLLLLVPGSNSEATLADNRGNHYGLYHGTHDVPPTETEWDFEGPIDALASGLTFTIQGYAEVEQGDWSVSVPLPQGE